MQKNDEDIRLGMSLEDYLEAIYVISKDSGSNLVRVTDISNRLKKSKPSVNTSIKILSKDGYLEHEHYGRVALTEKGKNLAKDIYYRHETIKEFFVNVLRIKPDVADKEACSIEHVLSSTSMTKFAKYISSVLKS